MRHTTDGHTEASGPVCVCGCGDCGRIYCCCLDCPCDGQRDHYRLMQIMFQQWLAEDVSPNLGRRWSREPR